MKRGRGWGRALYVSSRSASRRDAEIGVEHRRLRDRVVFVNAVTAHADGADKRAARRTACGSVNFRINGLSAGEGDDAVMKAANEIIATLEESKRRTEGVAGAQAPQRGHSRIRTDVGGRR